MNNDQNNLLPNEVHPAQNPPNVQNNQNNRRSGIFRNRQPAQQQIANHPPIRVFHNRLGALTQEIDGIPNIRPLFIIIGLAMNSQMKKQIKEYALIKQLKNYFQEKKDEKYLQEVIETLPDDDKATTQLNLKALAQVATVHYGQQPLAMAAAPQNLNKPQRNTRRNGESTANNKAKYRRALGNTI